MLFVAFRAFCFLALSALPLLVRAGFLDLPTVRGLRRLAPLAFFLVFGLLAPLPATLGPFERLFFLSPFEALRPFLPACAPFATLPFATFRFGLLLNFEALTPRTFGRAWRPLVALGTRAVFLPRPLALFARLVAFLLLPAFGPFSALGLFAILFGLRLFAALRA